MNLNPVSWLYGYVIRPEISKWTAAGLIQPEQERRIGDQYDRQCCGVAVSEFARLATYALATGAMLLALILIVADHWREIYLPLKVILAILSMSVAHGLGYWYRFHDDQIRLSTVAFFAGSILFGCVMLLAVDQYYAGSPYRSMAFAWVLFAWSAGTLPLAWIAESAAMLGLSCVLGAAWVICLVAATGNATTTSLFVAMVLCLIRWCYVNRSCGLLVVALASLAVWWAMMAVAENWGRAGFFWFAAPGPLLILIGLRHDATHPFASIYKRSGIGWSGLAPLVLSMPSVSYGLTGPKADLQIWLIVLAIAGAAIVLMPAPRRFDVVGDWPALAALSSVTIVPAALGLLSSNTAFAGAAAVILFAAFNAAAIAVIVSLVRRGALTECVGTVTLGIAYFVLWALLVAFDLPKSLTTAALIFAVAGSTLLVLVRLRPQKQDATHEAVSPANL